MSDFDFEITALDDYTESINMLVYGDPGSGKTVLGGTAPNGLILACENGTISAARKGSKADMIACTDYRTFANVLNALRKGKIINKATGKKYEWIVIDSLTALQQLLAQDIIRVAHETSPKRSAINLDLPGYQEWYNTFKRIVQALNDLDENVLYLCHAVRSTDEELESIITPDISGKNGTQDATTMSRWVCGTVHLYGYLYTGTKKDGSIGRKIIVERTGPYFGKDRYDVFNGEIRTMDMAEIQARILGNHEEKEN